ncbi:MAG TPA: carboxypeptidase-like regulatory domain-containing protein, partial [Rhodothermales bacterium]|nr:carboxypeptidase-like regulatory domain-containing protein [Rhodothermales bacterium]
MRTSFRALVLVLVAVLASAAQAQTGTLRGRVESTRGTAIAGATVRAALRGTTTSVSATTSAEGVYEFAGLAAGRYNIAASATGYAAVERENINVEAGQTVTLSTLRLAPTSPPEPTQLTFSGTVVNDATRQPIAGAFVYLVTPDGRRLAADTTDSRGAFSVGVTLPERAALLLRAEAAGYFSATVHAGVTVAPLVIGLTPVSGALASVSGVVRANGQPVAGATVRLSRVDPLALPQTLVRTTGATGAFRFDSLRAGTYVLVAAKTGYRTTNTDFRLSAGQALTRDVELRVAEPEPVRVEVSGRVITDGTGAPVRGARVTLYTVRDSGAVRPAGHGETNSEGRFTVRVAPGAYIAAVRINGERGTSYTEFYKDAQTPAEATPLSVGTVAPTVIEFSVPPPPQRVAVRVRGRVTSAAGTALAGAVVSFTQRDTRAPLAVARTGADGTYDAQFEAAVPLSLIASARAEGYLPEYYREAATAEAATAIAITASPYTAEGITFTLDARTAATGALTGTVTRAGSTTAVAGATVSAYAPGRRTTATTGTDGTYRFAALTAGSYVVLGTADGYAPTYVGSTLDTWLDATRVQVGPTAATANLAMEVFTSPGGTNKIVGKASTRDGR